MENTEQKSVNEIDLIEVSGKVLKQMGIFFKWAASIVQQVFIFFLRKSLWFAICIIAMLAFSYGVHKMRKPLYSTMMVARMNVLDNAFAISYVNNLNASLSDVHLAKKVFNLPDTSFAKHIKSIQGYWGVAYFEGGSVDFIDFAWKHITPSVMRDTLDKSHRVNDRFYVKVGVSSDTVQPYLTKGLIENICSIPYLQELNADRKARVRERITVLERQIKVLDSLQYYEYFVKDAKTVKPSMMGQLLLLNEKEKTLFHEEIMKLHNERFYYESDLKVNPEPATVIQGFETNFQRESSYFRAAKRMLVIGFLLTLVAALAWDNRKWLVDVIIKKP